MRWAALCTLLSVSAVASAQPRTRRDAGTLMDAGPSPRQLVDAARGGLRALDTFTGRQVDNAPREEAHPLPRVMPGRCYAVVGAAVGAAQVRVRVMARGATVVADTPPANSRGEAVRRDFCARHPTDWYALQLTAEGDAQWSVALVELPGDASAPEAPPPRPDAGLPPRDVPAVVFRETPIGGDDYTGNQIRVYARARPRRVGFGPLVRSNLLTNGVWFTGYALPAGRCVELVAAGVPSVRDLVLEIEDPAGHRVAQDGTHRATEAVRYCPRYAGTHTFRVRMFAGAGAVAAQVLIEP